MIETTLIGNLGRDAEIKESNGSKFIAFSVGVNENYTDRQGVRHESTTWVSCTKPIYNDNTALVAYLRKGTQVFLRGKPTARSYTRQDGTPEATLNLRVDSLQLLGSLSGTGQVSPTSPTASTQPQQSAPSPSPHNTYPYADAPQQPQQQTMDYEDSDLPF